MSARSGTNEGCCEAPCKANHQEPNDVAEDRWRSLRRDSGVVHFCGRGMISDRDEGCEAEDVQENLDLKCLRILETRAAFRRCGGHGSDVALKSIAQKGARLKTSGRLST